MMIYRHKIYLVVGKNSQTILHWAVEGGGYKCVRLLLNHTKQEDISVLKKDKFQVNSLHLAASRKSSKMLKVSYALFNNHISMMFSYY
jgi:ankyrin repeat protein